MGVIAPYILNTARRTIKVRQTCLSQSITYWWPKTNHREKHERVTNGVLIKVDFIAIQARSQTHFWRVRAKGKFGGGELLKWYLLHFGAGKAQILGAKPPRLRACIAILWLIFVDIRFVDISQYDTFFIIVCSYSLATHWWRCNRTAVDGLAWGM